MTEFLVTWCGILDNIFFLKNVDIYLDVLRVLKYKNICMIDWNLSSYKIFKIDERGISITGQCKSSFSESQNVKPVRGIPHSEASSTFY